MDKTSNSRYNQPPKFFGKGRTKFDLSHSILTTCNTGDLTVILAEPVVPGSTMSLKSASISRLLTSLHQTMDNAYIETAYFFVPSRVLWTNFDKYQGYNRDAWAQTQEFQKPQIYLGTVYDANNTVTPNSLLAHLALPSGVYFEDSHSDEEDAIASMKSQGVPSIDQLYLRAVFKCYNDWFREPTVDSEIYYDDGDTDISLDHAFLFNGDYFSPYRDTLQVNRFKDLFSTCTPQPQKGDPIAIQIGDDSAPVGIKSSGATYTSSDIVYIKPGAATSGDFVPSVVVTDSNNPVFADLKAAGLEFTINDLRIAIALQAMRERDLRSGNRLNEKLYGTWHIETNSLELDMSEYLGGKKVPVNMMEVLQTSETGTTVLGSDAGHSKTFDADDSFVRTFTQWGYVIGFAFVRTSRSYSAGLDRKFMAKDILDEYDPMLDNIGEMPVYKRELQYFGGDSYKNDSVFGFNEAWYWYKERQNRFSGYFQNVISGTLSSWHYGDQYYLKSTVAPYPLIPVQPNLSYSWMKETPENVDRTIAVTSEAPLGFQWMFNFHFELTNTFEASKYSIPNTFGF